MTAAKVSVLMPVFNAAPFVAEAADSILRQSFADFEFLILDDCSTDDSLDIIQRCAARDSRIRVLRNEKNRGLSCCRNRLMREARGEYFALMDADDISFPQRLHAQNQFLDHNPEVGIVGAWLERFGEQKKKLWRPPVSDWDIKSHLLFGPSIGQPTVMLRGRAVQAAGLDYDESITSAMDYRFWVDACRSITMANIPAPLLRYRVHCNQNSTVRKKIREAVHIRTAQKHLSRFGIEAESDALMRLLWPRDFPCASIAEIKQSRELIDSILSIKEFYGYEGVSPRMKKHVRGKRIRLWKRWALGKLAAERLAPEGA